MLPLSLLKTAVNHPMLVELKNGETYNGHLVQCDNWMNLQLRVRLEVNSISQNLNYHNKEVICTSRDGDHFWRMNECYVRGSTIKYLRIPDEVIDMVKEENIQRMKAAKVCSIVFSLWLQKLTFRIATATTTAMVTAVAITVVVAVVVEAVAVAAEAAAAVVVVEIAIVVVAAAAADVAVTKKFCVNEISLPFLFFLFFFLSFESYHQHHTYPCLLQTTHQYCPCCLMIACVVIYYDLSYLLKLAIFVLTLKNASSTLRQLVSTLTFKARRWGAFKKGVLSHSLIL